MEAKGKERGHSRDSDRSNRRVVIRSAKMREQDHGWHGTKSQGSSMFNVLRMVVLFSITELNQFTCPPSGNIYLHGNIVFVFFFLKKK